MFHNAHFSHRGTGSQVVYEWTGSTIMKTYKNIPNPTGNYGFWAQDEIGPF